MLAITNINIIYYILLSFFIIFPSISQSFNPPQPLSYFPTSLLDPTGAIIGLSLICLLLVILFAEYT